MSPGSALHLAPTLTLPPPAQDEFNNKISQLLDINIPQSMQAEATASNAARAKRAAGPGRVSIDVV